LICDRGGAMNFFGGEFLPFSEKYFQKQQHCKVKKIN
jgi:hypothetical protein